jgi:hypothetical protein
MTTYIAAMSYAEVICNWMEPLAQQYELRRQYSERCSRALEAGGTMAFIRRPRPTWWEISQEAGWPFVPVALTLDRLHEVEERLTERQQYEYSKELSRLIYSIDGPSAFYRSELFMFFHASPAQKIKALAKVIRDNKEPNDH